MLQFDFIGVHTRLLYCVTLFPMLMRNRLFPESLSKIYNMAVEQHHYESAYDRLVRMHLNRNIPVKRRSI